MRERGEDATWEDWGLKDSQFWVFWKIEYNATYSVGIRREQGDVRDGQSRRDTLYDTATNPFPNEVNFTRVLLEPYHRTKPKEH